MDDRLNELKEKQAQIGDKISLLQQTNKRKDEEAAEIRQLIQECRENLNRIKGLPDSENFSSPCQNFDLDKIGQDDQEKKYSDSARHTGNGVTNAYNTSVTAYNGCASKPPCCSREIERKRCDDILGRKEKKPDCSQRKKKNYKDRVSCKVDLNKMKVRIRGPPEDLKKLDATQLISLLEKCQCSELIINTGDQIIQDPGEIRLFYCTHPGNLVMVAGIIMVAFLINTNVCEVRNSCNKQLLLNVLYVGSFAFHYGMVLWMLFVRGYALRCGLNHDMFHVVDNLILPKYYSLCVLLGALSLYSFLETHCMPPCSTWPLDVLTQIIIVVTTFLLELITICYIIPGLIKLRDATDDYIFDDEEPDCSVPQSYEKNCAKLKKINWTLCIINLLTLILLGANIYYITLKLS